MTRHLLALLLLVGFVPQDPPASKFLQPKKADKTKETPLIVQLHGYGDTAENVAKFLDGLADEAGAYVLCVNGSEKIEGAGWGWDPAKDDKRVLDEIERIRKERKIGAVYLTGFSQGGHMTFSLGLRHAGLFRGLIPVSGAVSWMDDPTVDTSFLAKSKGMPVYIIHGTKDSVIPFEESQKAEKYLKENGMKVKVFSWEGDHRYPPQRLKEIKKAIEFIEKERADQKPKDK